MKISDVVLPVGICRIQTENGAIRSLKMVNSIEHSICLDHGSFVDLLNNYFAGRVVDFSTLNLEPHGTEFQMDVWKALCEIPYGELRTYSDIARAVGRPNAVRATGSAIGANPIAIFIPCHRVVRIGGDMGGYAYGLNMKKKLLKIEGQSV